MFYPIDLEGLGVMVDGFLAQVEMVEGEPIALIVPHAGYVYSGQVAAYAFKQMEGVKYESIVIVGNNHRDPTFHNISVWAEGPFETPLGLIPVDGEVAQALMAADERIVFEKKVHLYEHSIEVELPFLQRVCPDCRMVPVIVGEPSKENIEALSQALIKVLAGKKALIIASSDLSHYPHRDDARQVDGATLAAIESMEPDRFYVTTEEMMSLGIPNLATCACGEGPILVAMMAAKGLGANQATILKYANSGDSPLGEESEAVGYGAVMLWRWEPPNFSDREEAKLLQVARQTLVQYLQDASTPHSEVSESNLRRRLGAFVTLKRGGELRGCGGWITTNQPLYRTVQDSAVSAAVEDPRFPALTLEELEETTIEISGSRPSSGSGR
jgi:AmmeMemoRadiSam system protein B